MICPCKDCQGRYTACWDTCEKYRTWKDEKAKEQEQVYWGKYADRQAKQLEVERVKRRQRMPEYK